MPKRIIQQSDKVMADALADYQKRELTTEEIGVKHGISSATLTVWAKKTGIPLRNRGRKKQERPTQRQMEIIKLASVYKYDQVGERYGMKKQSIHRIVKRWRNWASPRKAPFDPGDILIWRGKRFIVIEANIHDGTLQDEKSGKRYINFCWGGGRIPKKIGENPKYFRATADAATA
jgi:hypothetical protein